MDQWRPGQEINPSIFSQQYQMRPDQDIDEFNRVQRIVQNINMKRTIDQLMNQQNDVGSRLQMQQLQNQLAGRQKEDADLAEKLRMDHLAAVAAAEKRKPKNDPWAGVGFGEVPLSGGSMRDSVTGELLGTAPQYGVNPNLKAQKVPDIYGLKTLPEMQQAQEQLGSMPAYTPLQQQQQASKLDYIKDLMARDDARKTAIAKKEAEELAFSRKLQEDKLRHVLDNLPKPMTPLDQIKYITALAGFQNKSNNGNKGNTFESLLKPAERMDNYQKERLKLQDIFVNYAEPEKILSGVYGTSDVNSIDDMLQRKYGIGPYAPELQQQSSNKPLLPFAGWVNNFLPDNQAQSPQITSPYQYYNTPQNNLPANIQNAYKPSTETKPVVKTSKVNSIDSIKQINSLRDQINKIFKTQPNATKEEKIAYLKSQKEKNNNNKAFDSIIQEVQAGRI